MWVDSRMWILAFAPALALSASSNHNHHCVSWMDQKFGRYIKPIALNKTADGGFGICRWSVEESLRSSSPRYKVGIYSRNARRGQATGPPICSDGNESSEIFEVAAQSHECVVWWHEQAYNALPLPLMTDYTLGSMGVCKVVYGPEDVVVGRLHGEGEHYAKCEHLRNGEVSMREGGFLLLGSYDKARPYESSVKKRDLKPKEELLANLLAFLDYYITDDDEKTIEQVSGHPFRELVEGIKELPARTLNSILSSERWVFSELNEKGLHLLRCLLAERITDARRRARGMDMHKDYNEFMEKGYLTRDFSTMQVEDVKKILMMVSGYGEDKLPSLTWELRTVTADRCDLNLDLHVDTYHPSWKLWLYAEDIDVDKGPTVYVEGSHRNDIRKLKWLYNVSNNPPLYGPGSYGSFRMDSVECEQDFESQGSYMRQKSDSNGASLSTVKTKGDGESEEAWNYTRRVPVRGSKLTLVVVDVSGLHARGVAKPGSLRRTMIVTGGQGGIERFNPFDDAKDFLPRAIQESLTHPAAQTLSSETNRGNETHEKSSENDVHNEEERNDDPEDQQALQQHNVHHHSHHHHEGTEVPQGHQHQHFGVNNKVTPSRKATTKFSDINVHRVKLHVPSMQKLASMMYRTLSSNFREVSVSVVQCPDLRDWGFASPGLSGTLNTIVDVGGEHHQVQSHANHLSFHLEELAIVIAEEGLTMNGKDSQPVYFLGAAAAPRASVGCNGELIPIDNLRDHVRNSKIATVEVSPDGHERAVLDSYDSGEMGFLANLMASDGKTGPVIEVRAAVRLSEQCESLTQCLQQGLKDQMAEHPELAPIGIGGVFKVTRGRVKTHVMADTGGKTFTHSSEVKEYLKLFNMGPDLTAATVFLSRQPDISEDNIISKKARLEHTHLFSDDMKEGGHYHGDVTPTEIEYLAYFVPNHHLLMVDRTPLSTR